MKVLMVSDAGSIHTKRWVSSLIGKGVEIVLFSITLPSDGFYEQQGGCTLYAMDMFDYKKRSFSKIRSVFRHLEAVRALKKVISQEKPDILHAHYATSYALVAALSGFHPFLISVWGSDVYEFPYKSRLHEKAVRYILSKSDKVLSTSRVMALQTAKFYGGDIEVTPFGVDTELFKRRLSGSGNPDTFVFGTVKTLSRKYGIDVLLRAFAHLQNLPGISSPGFPRTVLEITGKGQDREALERLAQELGIGDRVVFRGHVSHESLPEVFSRIDVAVFLSREESFGVAAVEAMSCSCPVVVSDAEGFTEVVEDGVSGIIVPREDPEAAAQAMYRLLCDRQLREDMGAEARKRVEKNYRWDDNVGTMLEVYRAKAMKDVNSDLKDKTIKGVSWGFVDNVFGAGILAVVNLVLARILTPEQFGIVGMTSIFMTLSTALVDSGFTGALTRKKTVGEKDFNTVFYFNLLTSIALYLLLFLLSPLIARFFNQPVLVSVIRILGLSLIITAVSIVQKVQLIRKIDFKTQAFISLGASVLSGIAGILMAFNGFGLWSLVALQIVKTAVTTLFLWAVSSWRPSFLFSMKSLSGMFSFGGRLLLTAIISVLWSEIYAIVIGKAYSASTLGQYTRAEKFRNMITSNVSIVMQKVSYPVLASIQDEKQRQARAYRKFLRTSVLVTFTAVLGLAAIAEPAVLVLVGDQWIPSVPYLRILCIAGLFMPLLISSANVINANGRSDVTLYLEIMKTLLALFPVAMGIVFSIDALLWSTVAVSAVSFLVYARFVSKVIPYKVTEQLKDIFPFFLAAAVMAAVVFTVSFLPLPQFLVLLLQLLVGAVFMITVCETVFRNEEYEEIKTLVLKSLHLTK